MIAETDDMATIRPQRVAIIGRSSGRTVLKKPLSETSITPRHWASAMPAMGASSCVPALWTMIWIGPVARSPSIIRAAPAPSVRSPTASSASGSSRTSASARSTLPCAWTITDMPSAASCRAIAAPIGLLPPVIRARFMPPER
jgi:hypothetical protein